jgi:hypothetical protein
MSSDPFWLNDFSIIFKSDKLLRFIPSKSMSLEEKLNSIVRFGLYLSILLMVLKENYLYMYIFVFSLIITYIIYVFKDDTKEKFNNQEKKTLSDIEEINEIELTDDESCREPTKNNPFMNPLLPDNYKNIKKSCSYTDPIKEKIDNYFYDNLFDDTSKLYGKRNSQRNFYSMPSTTIPNDQDGFAKWCYRVPKTCKEGNRDECYKNIHERHDAKKNY